MISCKVAKFFPRSVTAFKENMKLSLVLSFHSSALFVTGTIFTSEQIAECSFRALKLQVECF